MRNPVFTVVQPDTWWEMPLEYRLAVRTWMRANQLEANDIPVSEPITVRGNEIRYTRLLRDEEGNVRKGTCPFSGQWKIHSEEVIAPLKTDPPILSKD